MSEETTESGVWASIKETVKTVVYALLIAGVFRTLFFQPFWIPSGSMKDTLLIGDFLFVNKMAYGYSYASCPSIRLPSIGIDIDAEDFCGFLKGDNDRILGSEPERGDVVVFRHPVTGLDFIKRLVGMPGDRIAMIDGVLHINDEAVGLVPDGAFGELSERQGPQGQFPICMGGLRAPEGEICYKEKYIETLPNGVSHSVLNFMTRETDNVGVFTVPEGHYFFMGDNRDNSMDSRVAQENRGVGFVPYEDIVGRADRVMFSSAGRSMLAFWTWRSDRFFHPID